MIFLNERMRALVDDRDAFSAAAQILQAEWGAIGKARAQDLTFESTHPANLARLFFEPWGALGVRAQDAGSLAEFELGTKLAVEGARRAYALDARLRDMATFAQAEGRRFGLDAAMEAFGCAWARGWSSARSLRIRPTDEGWGQWGGWGSTGPDLEDLTEREARHGRDFARDMRRVLPSDDDFRAGAVLGAALGWGVAPSQARHGASLGLTGVGPGARSAGDFLAGCAAVGALALSGCSARAAPIDALSKASAERFAAGVHRGPEPKKLAALLAKAALGARAALQAAELEACATPSSEAGKGKPRAL